ncbi:serine hydrolase [Thermocatellispora tengchongensis]
MLGAAALLAPMLVCGCSGDAGRRAEAAGNRAASAPASPGPTGPHGARSAPAYEARGEQVAEAPPAIVAEDVTRTLDRFLAGRGGRVTAMVRDLATGRTYRYHPKLRLDTASTAKMDILMALLLKTPWKKLSAEARADAELMIKYSDNKAADRLWLRIGGPEGLTRAGRRFGLKHTTAVGGRCVDLYCWGITETSAEDRVRLLTRLAAGKGPLPRADRDQVIRLMTGVIPEQKWGVSAAACDGDVVALKNGWLRHVSNRRWAVASVGLIRGDGQDYAVAVLTEDGATLEEGIAKVQGVARRIMAAFRGERGCGDTAAKLAEGQILLRATLE